MRMKRFGLALGLGFALALPGYGLSHAATGSSPTSRGALVINQQFCGYSDLVLVFNDGSTVDFGPAYGTGTYVVTPSGNALFQCNQTLSNPWPATFPPQTLRFSTTCQEGINGPILQGTPVLTKSGNLETSCHA